MGAGKSVTWVMLNPSTADADVDDPTIRRCIGFSRRWGFQAMSVVNLFAWRATEPRVLLDVPDPVGARTTAVLREAVADGEAVVAAWGNLPRALRPRAEQVLRWLPRETWTLGLTRAGQPRHPLYVPTLAVPVPLWRVAPGRSLIVGEVPPTMTA